MGSPRREKHAVPVELLDAVVSEVRDVDVPARVGRDAGGSLELTVARAVVAPVVRNTPFPSNFWTRWKLSVTYTLPPASVAMPWRPLNCPLPEPPLPQVVRNGAARVELLDASGEQSLADEDVLARVDRQGERLVELALPVPDVPHVARNVPQPAVPGSVVVVVDDTQIPVVPGFCCLQSLAR
jgi:hypothetical protein